METKEFNKVVEKRLQLIKSILADKAKEYARGDRLHNFKRASSFQKQSPEMVCWNFAMKHFTSIQDLVEDIHNGYMESNLLSLSKEKIGDAINYLILLEALIEERVYQETKTP